MRFEKHILLWLATQAFFVDAGSRMWQPAAESATLQSRYFYINEKESDNPMMNTVTRWPDKTISYCFDSKESRKKLDKDLNAAQNRWITRGVSKELKIKRVSDDKCKDDHADRESVLKVSYGNKLSTFPGYPKKDHRFFGSGGPTMVLSDDISIGMLDKIANYAHELGHAWGLYHEHQNPKFWKGEQNSDDGEVFGSGNNGNWRCQNLKDYDKIMAANPPMGLYPGDSAQKPLTAPLNREQLCTHYNVARSKGFSASEYLPMPRGSGVGVDGKTVNDVDWDSIMIYPSGAGGKKDETNPGDPRASILMKPIENGQFERIKINTWPGTKDVAALCALYGVESTGGKLLQDKKPLDFFKVFNKGNKDC